MTAAQKLSYVSLIMCVLAAGSVCTIYLVTRNVQASAAGFAWLAGIAFGYMVYFAGKPGTVKDERDELIWERAGRAAFRTFWIVFVLVAVWYPFAVGLETNIPVSYLHFGAFAGAWIHEFARSLATVYLYSRS